MPSYAISNTGSVPRQTGMINSQSNQLALAPGQNGGTTQPAPPASHSVVTPGSTVSLIGNHTLKSTTDASGNITNYNAPKSNPSVLAQQQALNKQGAGLVEDGIAGPKTAAAIAKYANAGSTSTPSPTPTPTPDTSLDTKDLAKNVVGKSNTPGEAYTNANDVYQGLLDTYKNDLKQYNNNENGLLTQGGIPKNAATGRAGMYAAQNSGALNAEATALGASTAGLGAANTAQGMQNSEANTALSAGLNQQGSYGAPAFNAITGQFTSSGNFGNGPEATTNIQSYKDSQGMLNNITQNTPIITDNLTRAGQFAKSANLEQNSPLLSGIQKAISTGLLTNQSLTAFTSIITSLNQALQSVGESPIDVNTITPAALAQLQQTLPNNLKVKSKAAQDFMDKFNNSSNTNSSSNSKVEYNSNGTLKAVNF